MTLLEYKMKSPTKYMSPVIHSLSEDRARINRAAYEEMVREKGFKSFVSWWPTSAEHDMESFQVLSTLDYYYRRTLDLCAENGIEVYSVNTPLISETYEEAEKIRVPFSAYLQGLKDDYPEQTYPLVHIETEFASYDTDCFDDADHLNPYGAQKYTEWFCGQYLNGGNGA